MEGRDRSVPMGFAASLRAWAMASRPHTLTISINPVLVGLRAGVGRDRTGRHRADGPLGAGRPATSDGTNLDNDVSDAERGTDRAGRIGLPRATALGLLRPGQVRTASRACFALATAIGLVLAWRGGWPILIAGIAAATAAMGYSGGTRPISYTPFGDVVVWLFFGLVAVGGTYYLQTGSLSSAALTAATLVGFPATAVLVVNNYRDLDPDARSASAPWPCASGGPSAAGNTRCSCSDPSHCWPCWHHRRVSACRCCCRACRCRWPSAWCDASGANRPARHSMPCSRKPPSSR
jgi:1,4-dihydroxy-2-naphthoate octaprenyltransferase